MSNPSNELAVVHNNDAVTEPPSLADTVSLAARAASSGGDLIRETAALLVDAEKIAVAVCNTFVAPKHVRGKPQEAIAIILYGASLGLDPMTSMQNIYEVHGSPGMYARMMKAVCLRDGHEIWTVESNDKTCTVRGRRRGSDIVEESTWTIERAALAGYTKNAKYKENPQEMLYAKATAEACRRTAPDSLAGIYAMEELQLEEKLKAEITSAARRGKITAATFTTPAAVEAAPAAGADPKADLKAMFGAFDRAGFTSDPRTDEGKAHRLDYMGGVLGRLVESTNDLTPDDIAAVTEALRVDAGQGQ